MKREEAASMSGNPNEMTPEEIEASYGKAEPMSVVSHVIGVMENAQHDRVTIDAITEDGHRLLIPFNQSALKTLVHMVEDALKTVRPRTN
jgi:hypothetical protein